MLWTGRGGHSQKTWPVLPVVVGMPLCLQWRGPGMLLQAEAPGLLSIKAAKRLVSLFPLNRREMLPNSILSLYSRPRSWPTIQVGDKPSKENSSTCGCHGNMFSLDPLISEWQVYIWTQLLGYATKLGV